MDDYSKMVLALLGVGIVASAYVWITDWLAKRSEKPRK